MTNQMTTSMVQYLTLLLLVVGVVVQAQDNWTCKRCGSIDGCAVDDPTTCDLIELEDEARGACHDPLARKLESFTKLPVFQCGDSVAYVCAEHLHPLDVAAASADITASWNSGNVDVYNCPPLGNWTDDFFNRINDCNYCLIQDPRGNNCSNGKKIEKHWRLAGEYVTYISAKEDDRDIDGPMYACKVSIGSVTQTHGNMLVETAAPAAPVTSAPVSPVTTAPVDPVTAAPVAPDTAAPVAPDTAAPVAPVTSAPVVPPPVTSAPVTSAPVVPPPVTSAPVDSTAAVNCALTQQNKDDGILAFPDVTCADTTADTVGCYQQDECRYCKVISTEASNQYVDCPTSVDRNLVCETVQADKDNGVYGYYDETCMLGNQAPNGILGCHNVYCRHCKKVATDFSSHLIDCPAFVTR